MPDQLNPEQELTPVVVFDTTLRDGLQDPAVSATQANALYVAESLAEAGIDVIEAGFPASSPGNFATVATIAERVDGPVIAAFARTMPEDIIKAGEALGPAGERARINVCTAFSDLHIQERFHTTREKLLDGAVKSTEHALRYTDDVQFSFEDSTRADLEFLKESVLAVADAGATTMMLPDTVGAMLPRDYSERLLVIREALDARGFGHVVIAAHCHNDMGQGVMSSIDALRYGGARQVDLTIGGIGERNGNVPLEVVAGIIAVKGGEMGLRTNVDPMQLHHLAHEVAPKALGAYVSEKQPFIGASSYLHGSGMHQDGIMKHESTFKDFPSSIFGFDRLHAFMINDQSGKAGIRHELSALYVDLGERELKLVTDAVKERSTSRGGQNLGHNELEELASEITGEAIEDKFKLEEFEFRGDNEGVCEVDMTVNGQKITESSEGGVVDATVKAAKSLTDFEFKFKAWDPDKSHSHDDSAGEVGIYVTMVHNGNEIMAYAKSKVIERASAEACIKAISMLQRIEERSKSGAAS